MNYEKYMKQTYMKMALKGQPIQGEQWENALIGVQCLYMLNAHLQSSASNLLGEATDEFNDAFSNGKPMPYDNATSRQLLFYLRAQCYMKAATMLVLPKFRKLDSIIVQNKESIDPAIWNAYVGNKALLANFAVESQNQVQAIDASARDCFAGDKDKVEVLRQAIEPQAEHINNDTEQVISKVANALGLVDILQGV